MDAETPPSLDEETFEHLRREMVGLMRRMARGRHKPPFVRTGVTPLEMETLIATLDLAREQEGARPSGVAALLGTSPSTLSQTVGALVRKGLMTRCRMEDDSRGVELRLTEAGAALAQEVSDGRDERARALFAYLGEDDARNFMRIGRKIAEFHRLTCEGAMPCRRRDDGVREDDEGKGEGACA